MAMTKKEQTEMEELKKQLGLSRAFKFTKFIPTDVEPTDWSKLTTGWTMNPYNKKVEQSCSTTNGHALGRTDKTTSQNGIRMYSTELLALKALRYELEQKFAMELAEIDIKIETLENQSE